ncbi:MAG: hypothetical protein QOH10_214 [Actinomycetota bacterium]|nr:hypothetical protein [Actinomycetota bacterium]
MAQGWLLGRRAVVGALLLAIPLACSPAREHARRAPRISNAAAGHKIAVTHESEGDSGTADHEGSKGEVAGLDYAVARAFPYKRVPDSIVARARVAASRLPIVHPTTPAGAARPAQLLAKGRAGAKPAVGPVPSTVDPASLPSPTWGALGPRPTYQIYGYTDPYGGTPPWAGRVAALATDPTNSNVAYAGSAGGGVWKTTDGGVTWNPRFDAAPSLSIGALAVDPLNAQVVYAATGEANNNPDGYYGAGLFKSTNGGTSWAKLAGTQFDSCHLADIAIKPGTSTTLLLAVQGRPAWTVGVSGLDYGADGPSDCNSRQGIYRSIDSGVSWTRVLTGTPSDLAVSPLAPTVWYGGLRDGGVWKSTNSGQTWAQLPGLPTTGGRVALAAAPNNAARLYAFIAEANPHGNDLLGAWTSPDSGSTWTPITVPSDFCNLGDSPQCDYDLVVTVDPTTSNTFYAGGINLYKFTNAGAVATQIGQFKGNYTAPDVVHVDFHAFALDASQRLWIGNDGGVYRTADSGTHFANLNADLEITQFSSVAGWLPIGGTQDNGSQYFNSGTTWLQYMDGDGGPAAINPQNEYETYGQFHSLAVFKSLDADQSVSLSDFGIPVGTPRLFYSPVEMNPAQPASLYGGTTRIYHSANSGQTWLSYSPDFLSGKGRVTAIGVAPSSKTTLYAAAADTTGLATDLQRTADGGASWTPSGAGLPLAFTNEIVVDPKNADRVYVGMGGFGHGHVFASVNGGASWTDVSGNLPDISVNSLVADFRTSPPTLYAANDVGVFASTDGGANWARFGTGLPNVVVNDLALDAQSHILVAGTYGRSVWAAFADGVATAPGNDAFQSASPITGTSGGMWDTSLAATKEPQEPNHAGNLGGRSIWYRWKAPRSGTVTITTNGSNYDTLLGVYTGTDVSALTTIASNDNISGNNKASIVSFAAVAGTTYRIAVDGAGGTSGAVTLSWLTPPVNDTFAQARNLTGPHGSAIVSNVGATAQSGEPAGPDASPSHRTVWFKRTPPKSGTLKLDASLNLSLYSIVGVYTGTSVNALTLVGSKTKSVDTVSVSVTAGTTYWIQLDTVQGATGTLRLDW